MTSRTVGPANVRWNGPGDLQVVPASLLAYHGDPFQPASGNPILD